jgi:MYXO-CTERM domain-containing protein
MFLPIVAVLSTMQFEGDVTADGGDYAEVTFPVPAGTVEIHITHDDGSEAVILDFGVWSPEGFRGWGGGNTEDIIIGVEESSRSYRIGAITPGDWTVVIGKAQLANGMGSYSIVVTCHDVASLAVRPRVPFEPVVLGTERRWYKGDFHVHSSESGDANASFDAIGTLAAERGLDFVNLSEHNTDSQLELQTEAQARHPAMLFLRGAEITTYAGHGNGVGLPGYIDHRIGFAGRTITGVLDDVGAAGALFIVNHPVLDLGDECIGCSWEHADTPWDKVAAMEIITGPWDLVERLFVPRAMELWDQQLDAGNRIAAVSGSDDHRAGTGTGITDTPIGSPTTLVLADNLSEEAILAGIRAGRTMVMMRGPDDPFVDAHIARADGSAAEIGDDIDGISTVTLTAQITGGSGNFAQVWRDGVEVDQTKIDSDDFTYTFAEQPGAGPHRYRVELINDANQRIVVTSHFYVDALPPEEGGCGCRSSSGSSAGLSLGLLALLLRRRRR